MNKKLTVFKIFLLFWLPASERQQRLLPSWCTVEALSLKETVLLVPCGWQGQPPSCQLRALPLSELSATGTSLLSGKEC